MGRSIFCLVRHKWGAWDHVWRTVGDSIRSFGVIRKCARCGKDQRIIP